MADDLLIRKEKERIYMIKFKTSSIYDDFTIVSFELEGTIGPDILYGLKPPRVDETKGVVISGRGPIWLFCYLTHYYHPTKFVATYDPRIGAIVVESHMQGVVEGEIIPMILDNDNKKEEK